MWSLANRTAPSNEIFGASLIGAFDAALVAGTTMAYARGLSVRPFATAAIFLAAPATAGSIAGLIIDDDHRAGFIALTAMSSALLLHGVIVNVLGAPVAAPTPTALTTPAGHVAPGLAWSSHF